MQTVKELTRGFSFSQAKTAGLILGQWYLTELVQQVLLTFGQEGSLGFRVERPHVEVPRLGKSAIARKVKVKALE